MDELKLAAISIRVSLISDLSASNGTDKRAFILSLRAARDGMMELSLIKESSKSVGTLTF